MFKTKHVDCSGSSRPFWISVKCKSGAQRACDISQHLLRGLAATTSTTVAFWLEGQHESDLSANQRGLIRDAGWVNSTFFPDTGMETCICTTSQEFGMPTSHINVKMCNTSVQELKKLFFHDPPDSPDPQLSVCRNPRRDSTSPPPPPSPFTSVSLPLISNRRAPTKRFMRVDFGSLKNDPQQSCFSPS